MSVTLTLAHLQEISQENAAILYLANMIIKQTQEKVTSQYVDQIQVHCQYISDNLDFTFATLPPPAIQV